MGSRDKKTLAEIDAVTGSPRLHRCLVNVDGVNPQRLICGSFGATWDSRQDQSQREGKTKSRSKRDLSWSLHGHCQVFAIMREGGNG
jgi:hypothetical protein